MLIKDTAICLRTTDYSETSQIVTLFTRTTGKISAIAKGAKRPKSAFDGPIEILSFGQIVFSDTGGDKLATLTEFQQKSLFTCTTNNLFALNCSLFAAELLNSLTHDYDPHPELFDSFLRFLQHTNEMRDAKYEQRELLSLLILFQLTLLREIGLMPVLNACVNCRTSHQPPVTGDKIYFSSSANGLVCGDCEASFPDRIGLSKNAIDCFTNTRLIAQAQDGTLKEIEKALIHHFTEILHKPPKMAKHILKS
ncbi:MAG: DNA repair protein RecO [Phycisphaerae bacterium]|nr:DNA repair protein RecO [Phycisphaerae bacterium]